MQIYKITHKDSGKIYIGQDANDRELYYGSGRIIREEVKRLGKESFTKEILCQCISQEDMDAKEKLYIEQYNSRDPKIGYNIAYGGKGTKGIFHGEEFSKKISEIVKKRFEDGEIHGMLGGTHSQLARDKISETHKGRPKDEEHKKKIGLAQKGKPKPQKIKDALKKGNQEWREKVARGEIEYKALSGENHPKYGKEVSDETRRKRSETMKATLAKKPKVEVSKETRAKLAEKSRLMWEKRRAAKAEADKLNIFNPEV